MSDQTPKWRIYRLSARDSNGPPELFDAYRADDVDAEIEQWKLDYAIAVASRDAEIARLGGKPGEVGGGTGEGDAPDRPDRQTYMQADSTTLAERNEAVKAVASLSTRYVTLAARCEALEQENAAQAEQITDLAKALREVQDTAAGFKASLSDAKQKQEPT